MFTEFFGADPVNNNATPISYASIAMSEIIGGVKTDRPLNANARDTENVLVSLGSGDDVTQLFNSAYQYNLTVYAGAGSDTFNVGTSVHNSGRQAILNGEAGDDIFFAFDDEIDDGQLSVAAGSITGTASIQFNGGTHSSSGKGDMFRVAGDGVVTGTYRPSSTLNHAGRVTVAGYVFDFTGVEPVVIHGLSDFDMLNADSDPATTDPAANLSIDSLDLEDLALDKLVLHEVTINGVATWSEQAGLSIPETLDTRGLGRAAKISGDTLVVSGNLQGQTSSGSQDGVVYVYTWSTDRWVEQAKLYASDRGSAGEGFVPAWISTATRWWSDAAGR